jgi:hypothetical protein
VQQKFHLDPAQRGTFKLFREATRRLWRADQIGGRFWPLGPLGIAPPVDDENRHTHRDEGKEKSACVSDNRA